MRFEIDANEAKEILNLLRENEFHSTADRLSRLMIKTESQSKISEVRSKRESFGDFVMPNRMNVKTKRDT